jgi:hypothetical protein
MHVAALAMNRQRALTERPRREFLNIKRLYRDKPPHRHLSPVGHHANADLLDGLTRRRADLGANEV